MIALQEVDSALVECRKVLERYATSLSSRQGEVKRLAEQAAETKAAALDLEKRVREAERHVNEWRESLKKFAGQQTSVKTQKEYDTLNHEIQETEKKISDADEQGLEFLEEEEALEAKLVLLESDLEARRGEYEEERARVTEREAEKSKEIAMLTARRDGIVGAMDPEYLRQYGRLRERHLGDIVVPVEAGICGGCFMKVVSHRIQSIDRADEEPVHCNACQRFLYKPESAEQ